MRVSFNPGLTSFLRGRLLYYFDEYSFNFIPESGTDYQTLSGKQGAARIMVQTLAIETGIDQRNLMQIWGYCPYMHWKLEELEEEWLPQHGTVTMQESDDLEPGVAIDFFEDARWKMSLYRRQGLVHITHNNTPDELRVEIATGTTLGITANQLNSIWLKPQFEGTPRYGFKNNGGS